MPEALAADASRLTHRPLASRPCPAKVPGGAPPVRTGTHARGSGRYASPGESKRDTRRPGRAREPPPPHARARGRARVARAAIIPRHHHRYPPASPPPAPLGVAAAIRELEAPPARQGE